MAGATGLSAATGPGFAGATAADFFSATGGATPGFMGASVLRLGPNGAGTLSGPFDAMGLGITDDVTGLGPVDVVGFAAAGAAEAATIGFDALAAARIAPGDLATFGAATGNLDSVGAGFPAKLGAVATRCGVSTTAGFCISERATPGTTSAGSLSVCPPGLCVGCS